MKGSLAGTALLLPLLLSCRGALPPASVSPPTPAIPMPSERYAVREGRALFHHYCSTCHGEEGHGDGLNAFNLDPKPRDLADPGFLRRKADDDLMAAIVSGGGASGLSTSMPPWGRTLNRRQVYYLIDFIRTLPARGE